MAMCVWLPFSLQCIVRPTSSCALVDDDKITAELTMAYRLMVNTHIRRPNRWLMTLPTYTPVWKVSNGLFQSLSEAWARLFYLSL